METPSGVFFLCPTVGSCAWHEGSIGRTKKPPGRAADACRAKLSELVIHHVFVHIFVILVILVFVILVLIDDFVIDIVRFLDE